MEEHDGRLGFSIECLLATPSSAIYWLLAPCIGCTCSSQLLVELKAERETSLAYGSCKVISGYCLDACNKHSKLSPQTVRVVD
jgi:hypothetical protein